MIRFLAFVSIPVVMYAGGATGYAVAAKLIERRNSRRRKAAEAEWEAMVRASLDRSLVTLVGFALAEADRNVDQLRDELEDATWEDFQ
jgi:hypothetical protein